MEPLLKAENLSVRYRTRRGYIDALSKIDLDVFNGETLGIVGETGCGKWTFGKSILGVLPPKTQVEGRILFKGRNLARLTEPEIRAIRGKEIALIFQDPMTRLNPLMRVEDHFLEEISAHDSLSISKTQKKTANTLNSIKIPKSRFRNYPHEFSKNMHQRIMINMAIV